MKNAIGVIELNSIAKGIESADLMLKASSVELLESKSICPGKYMIIVFGDVSAVESSLEVGIQSSKAFYVDHVLIPNVHEDVVKAIRGIPEIGEFGSVGVLEFFSSTGAIYAADAAVKAAGVSIVDMRLGYAIGGKSFVTLTGDLSAIEAAVSAGEAVGEEKGLLFNVTTIPSPNNQLIRKLV